LPVDRLKRRRVGATENSDEPCRRRRHVELDRSTWSSIEGRGARGTLGTLTLEGFLKSIMCRSGLLIASPTLRQGECLWKTDCVPPEHHGPI
jgi:hypothetical protein